MNIGYFNNGRYTHPLTEAARIDGAVVDQTSIDPFVYTSMFDRCLSEPEFVGLIGIKGVFLDEPLRTQARKLMREIVMRDCEVDNETAAYVAVNNAEVAIMNARRDERWTARKHVIKKIITFGLSKS